MTTEPPVGEDAVGPVSSGVIWLDDDVLLVDGVEFVARTTDRFVSSPERFCLVKPPSLVRQHLKLLADLRPSAVVEIGVFQGGSCALVALVAAPDVMVAVELSQERVPALDELLAARGLSDRVHVHHGVDQSDAPTLHRLLDEHLGATQIDLVVDDASHLVGPSRASFNALFPRLRPGGAYVLEDWSWAHIGFGSHLPDETPLTKLVFEMTMALPSRPGLIEEIRIDRSWAVVVRGDAELDPLTFDISACYSERGRGLLASGQD